MKDKLKSRIATAVVVIATVVLAGVAVFTAMRLYNLRGKPVAPTAPTTPSASTGDEIISCQELAFTISEPSVTPTGSTTPTSTLSPTATATLTPTSTPTSTPTATATPTSTSAPTPTDEPRGGSDPTPTPTTQPTSTPTPTDVPQTSTSTPTPTDTLIADSGTQAGTGDETAQLPAAGVSFPTIIAISLGMLLVLFALVLAL